MKRGGVICSGSIIHDTLVHPVDREQWGTTTRVDTIEPHIGGNGSNTSIALSRLGVPVRLLAAVGLDDAGDKLLRILADAGVDTNGVERVTTPTAATVAIVNSGGDRKFFHRLGASAEAFRNGIRFTPALLDGMSHYHLASIFLMPHLRSNGAGFLASARKAGLTTSLDTNWDTEGRWMADLGPCLEDLDYVFLNEDEARMATGKSHPAAAAEVLLGRGARTVVIKLGGRGCAVFDGAREIRCPGYRVQVKDTTGAGDCYVAGFLAASLEGASLEEAGRFANACGALTVEQVGGANGVTSAEAVRQWQDRALFGDF